MKLKNLFLVFYFALPVLIFVRIFQLTEMIDSSTGFYVEGFESAGTYIAWGIALAMIIFVILGRINDLWPQRAPGASVPMAFVSGFMGLGLIFEVWDFLKSFAVDLEKTKILNSTAYDAKAIKAMTQERNFQIVGGGLYMILLCTALLFFVYYAWSNVRPARRMPIYSIFPVLWAAVRLGRIFMQYTGIADISENIFDIMMLCLMLLFWLLHARVLTGYGYEASVKWIFGIGLSASLMAIICTAPRLYVTLFGGGFQLHEASAPKLINIASAVYMWYFLFGLKKMPSVSASRLKVQEEELLASLRENEIMISTHPAESTENSESDSQEPVKNPEKTPDSVISEEIPDSINIEETANSINIEEPPEPQNQEIQREFDIDEIIAEAKKKQNN